MQAALTQLLGVLCLDRVTVCPQRIGAVAASALVLTALDRGTR
jgi:hypothetical protein